VIKLIDVDGNIKKVRSRGQFNITKHNTVLQILTNQARKYHQVDVKGSKDPGHSWSLDKTGMLEASRLHMSSENKIQQQEISEINMIEVPKEILTFHGNAPPTKADGTVRLICKNGNGFCNQLSGNEKVERAREIHEELEVDIAAYCKHQLNMRHKKNCNGFNQLFKGGEAEVRSIVAHNVHKNIGRVQQGGTSLLLFGHLTKQLDKKESGKDKTGLGRWSVMTLQGDRVHTRIICSYNPCGNAKLNSGTTYQQHRRYFMTMKRDITCPRKHFHDDLMKQLHQWHQEGDRLVVCMDANEDIYKKSLGKSLTCTDGLNMVEVVGEFTQKRICATFSEDQNP
jgi:hypothetical protein